MNFLPDPNLIKGFPTHAGFATIAAAIYLVVGTVRAEFVEITDQGIATQSSEWNGGQFPAGNAVDGDPTTFCHTDGDTANNAWQLEFDREQVISRVELDMRAACCEGRMGGATLRWFDGEGDSVFDAPITDPGSGQTVVFELPEGIVGRSLRVGFEGGATNPGAATTLVHLGEVRVFTEIDLLPAILSFAATPAAIAEGESADLVWQTEGADHVVLIGSGPVPPTGSVSVAPATSAIYTLVASNAHGDRYADATVIVGGELLLPRINEFMASNSRTITRSDGSTPDWIEIWNPNPHAFDLEGYRLTDDSEQPARFVFPTTSIPPGGYLIVDAAADALDGVPATGFALDRSAGATLTLSDPAGQVLQSFSYPKQRADISYGIAAGNSEKYFLTATPGAANITGFVDGFVADTQFSVKRGLYDTPQTVAITTATPGATIYTTTDGSDPSPDNLSATAYSAPLGISTTTVLRAAAFLDGFQPTNTDTQSYIFPAEVGTQPAAPADFPPSWVHSLSGVQSPVPALSHFGMDAGVLASLPLVDSDGLPFDLADALRAIPSMSMVIDADVLFDPTDGLHVNAQSRGRTWERPASIEVIDPISGDEVQANCGLRMHGGWNRYPEMLKKSFRLYFRSEYGDSKFKFPLFPDVDIGEFDRLILRSGNGKAWASPWRALSGGGNSLERNTYLRDQFVRDLQAATGNPHIPGRFVHLYINGHYWGLYNPVERPDEHFAAARFGGVDDDYDVIKWRRGVGHRVAAGDDVGWNALIGLVRGTPANEASYATIGDLLDLPNFVDYMLVNYFAGNGDWIDNNVYAMRNRTAGGAFRFFCWDSEESFFSPATDVTNRLISDTCTEIHHALRANAEYRQLFADRAQRHLFNSGALTQSNTDKILAARVAEIDRAIAGDSARWGSLLRPSNPYDRADWLKEVNNLRDNYLGARVTTTLNQLRADDLFPVTDAPIFSPQRGGQVSAGSRISLASPGEQTGAIYYTLDGSDPRLAGGAVSPEARLFDALPVTLLSLGSDWLYLDDGSDLGGSDIVVGSGFYGSGNWKHADFDDSAWGTGAAPLGYGGISGAVIETAIGFGPDETERFTTSYFRRSFDLTDSSQIVSLRLRLMRDDGAVVYLNGHEIVRSGFPEAATVVGADTFAIGVAGSSESRLLEFAVPHSHLVDGSNTLAVEVHQASISSSDLGFDLGLEGDVAVGGGLIEIVDDTLVRTRVLSGGVWSAIDEALFVVGDRSADLYVSEIMFHPAAGGAEFLEIANRGSATHALGDLRLSGGIQFDFSGATVAELAPGERLVLVRDVPAFNATHPGVATAGEYGGALGNGGDSFSLEQDTGTELWTFSYGDDAPWPGGTDGDGHSMVYIDGDQNVATSWRPSVSVGGHPMNTDSIVVPPGGDLIAYALRGQSVVYSDLGAVELYISSVLGADEVILQPEWSTDLRTWSRADLFLSSQTPAGDGISITAWTLRAPTGAPQLFFRSKLSLR